MFKNKHLKQLQEIQAQIKNCKASIAKLDPPVPNSSNMGYDLYHWLSALFFQNKPDVYQLYQREFTGFNDAKSDYLRELGKYFMNIADYYQEMKRYETELAQLQIKERSLKDKLGIE